MSINELPPPPPPRKNELSQSKDLIQENIQKLKTLFPEIVTENKIDFKGLREILGEEIEQGDEKYFLNWKGKKKARSEAHKPSTGTLRPVIEESLDWDTTQNLYIEGDNLEVLKLLQKSYAGKIKVIYADPPYNTGNDILYKNDFSDNLSSYLQLTNQSNKNKDLLFTNTESNGRYHSEWLSMMYSRIKLSKNLLTNDGFFVISIDHNELHNLIIICDNIFGKNRRVGVVTVLSNPMGRQHGKYFTPTNEFMLVYVKNKDYGKLNKIILHEEDMKSFDMKDSKGKYKLESFIRTGGGDESLRINKPKAWYPLYVNLEQQDISLTPKPKYQQVFPITPSGQERTWLWVKDSPKIDTNELLPQMNDNGKIEVYRKYRVEEGKMVSTVWKHKKYNANHHGSRDLEKDMDEKKIFSYPKSKNLLIDIFKITASENSLIIADLIH